MKHMFSAKILHKKVVYILCLMILLTLCGCTAKETGKPSEPASETERSDPEISALSESEETSADDEDKTQIAASEGQEMNSTTKMSIDGRNVTVVWEDNESVSALKELVKQGPLKIRSNAYGGFEQVGSLGTSLPRNDVQTVTQPGDIVLYSGNQIVVFYGSNSWAYTRLGRIDGMSRSELKDLLGRDSVEMILTAE